MVLYILNCQFIQIKKITLFNEIMKLVEQIRKKIIS